MATSANNFVVFKPEPMVPVTKLEKLISRVEAREMRKATREKEEKRWHEKNRREIAFRKELNKRLDLRDAETVPVKTGVGFCEAYMSEIMAAVADAADCYRF